MPLPRLLHLLPATAVLAVAVWAGTAVLARRAQDRPREWRLQLPGQIPELRPFAPADEAERQILDLLHEPLIRLDRQGRPAPALAEEWRWHLRVSCWFADAERAAAARTRLLAVPAETRLDWGLETVHAKGSALELRFAKPSRPTADAALGALAGAEPRPLTFLRIEAVPGLRDALETHLASAPEGLHRLWFDHDGACEIVTSLPPLAAREALVAALRPNLPRLPDMRPLAEVTGLAEPVLEFRWSPTRARWPDGRAISVEDVQATVRAVLAEPAARGRGELRHVQSIEAFEGGLRAVYRRSSGAALAAWIGLPILPATPTSSGPPAGAGAWQVSHHDPTSLVLETRQDTSPGDPRRLRFFPAQSPSATRLTVAAGGLDAVWPSTLALAALEPWLERRVGTPRGRVLLLWNSRSERVGDPALRAALGLAIDREALVQAVAPHRARPLFTHFSSDLWYEPDLPNPIADVTAARTALDQLGWLPVEGKRSRQGRLLEFSLLVPEGNSQRQLLAEALSRQWRSLGVNVRVEPVPAADLVGERLVPGRFDAVLLGREDTPEWDVTEWWHSRSRRTGLNFSGVADPRLDLLLEALADEFDTSRIPERVRAVEQRLRDLQVALPLLGDEPEIGLRRDRFADRSGASLRDLLRPAAPPPLQLKMLEPKE